MRCGRRLLDSFKVGWQDVFAMCSAAPKTHVTSASDWMRLKFENVPRSPSQKSNELDDELKQVIDAPSLEAKPFGTPEHPRTWQGYVTSRSSSADFSSRLLWPKVMQLSRKARDATEPS